VGYFRRYIYYCFLEHPLKIAAGCFGCLTFFFLLLMIATGPIVNLIATTDGPVHDLLAPFSAALLYVNSGCCCLSGVLSIVFLAVGLMGGKKDADG
jgi:hypothetical protein